MPGTPSLGHDFEDFQANLGNLGKTCLDGPVTKDLVFFWPRGHNFHRNRGFDRKLWKKRQSLHFLSRRQKMEEAAKICVV